MFVKYDIHSIYDVFNMNAQLDCLRKNGFVILSKSYNETNLISLLTNKKVIECNVEITNVCEDNYGERDKLL